MPARTELQTLARGKALNKSAITERLRPQLGALRHEAFAVAFLDAQGAVIRTDLMFHGDAETVFVNVSEIARAALRNGARSILVAHNHPLRDATPSPQDVRFTRRLLLVATVAGITLVDHLIFAGEDVHSMADQGPWEAPLEDLAELLGLVSMPVCSGCAAAGAARVAGACAGASTGRERMALSLIADIATGSTTANSLPNIAKIADAALYPDAAAMHGAAWTGGRS